MYAAEKGTYRKIARRKTIPGIARHRGEGAPAEATRSSEEARAAAVPASSEQVTTSEVAAATNTEAREAATAAKQIEAHMTA